MSSANLLSGSRVRHSGASTSTSTWRKPLNWVPAAILCSPLHPLLSSKTVLFEFVGRRSGRRFATPVSYHQLGSTLLISTDSPWFKNFTTGVDQATVQLRGQRRQVRVEVVSDPGQAVDELISIVRAHPGYGRWAHIKLGPGGEPDHEDARAEIARGRVLLRLHLLDQ